MRTPLVLCLSFGLALAGCITTSEGGEDIISPVVDVDDVCDIGICAPLDVDMEEADLQPTAAPLLAFHQDAVASVKAFARTDGGWALSMRDTDGDWHVLVIDGFDGTAKRYSMPQGHTMAEHGLRVTDGRLLATSWPAGGSGATLHTWDLETDGVTTVVLDVPTPVRPVGAWDDDVLLSAPKGLLSGDSSAWVYTGDDLVGIGADGRVMDAAMVTGLLYLVVQKDGNWSVQMHDVDGDVVYPIWSSDAPIDGVWGNDGHAAFSVIKDSADPAGGELWEIDHQTHNVTRMGQGWDVRFIGDQEVRYLTASTDTSPFVAEWNRDLATYSEGVFLPDGEFWDVSGEGQWWLEVPRTDHRYTETANPTPYTVLLMTSER